jgi:ABC-2 type transport system ATP-binding protein
MRRVPLAWWNRPAAPRRQAVLHPGAERKFYLRADVRAVSSLQAEGMTEFDVVTVRGLRKSYGPGVVAGRLDFDVQHGEIVGLADADGAGKMTTVECIQGLRRPDGGVLSVLGYRPVTGAARSRLLTGSQLQGSALPHRLRAAGALDLFAILRARDGARLLKWFGLGQRRRSGYCSLSGGEPQRLFLVLALRDCPRRMS